MMLRIRVLVLTCLILLLTVLTGCGSKAQASVSGAPFQAAVRSVEILQVVGAPTQLRAWVKGDLPDGCSRLSDPVVSVSGGLVVVILPAARDAAAKTCPAGPVPYERVLNLGSTFAPGSYSIQINGFEAQASLGGEGNHVVAVTGGNAAQSPTMVAAAAVVTRPAAVDQPAAEQPTPTPAVPVDQPTVYKAAPASPTPTATAVPAVAQVQPAGGGASGTGCVNKAAFYADVTVDDGTLFDPGQAFTKTWQVKNAGTCAWTGYLLVFQEGDPLSAAQPVRLERSVAPGELVEISIPMTAPQKPGSYYSDWLLAGPDRATFGTGAAGNGLLWVKIGVRSPIPVTGGPVCVYQSSADYEAQVLALVNDARTAQGLKPLALDQRLSAAARGHSQDMACANFVEHYGSDGSTWYSRVTAQGVPYRSASENIYAGDPTFGGTPQGAFNWWMNSQIHHDNILNPKATKIGIGYVSAPQSTYKGYYTLNFVEP